MIRKALHLLRHGRVALATRFWTAVARLRLAALGAQVGRGLVVTGPVLLRIHPTARVVIGEGCTFHSGFAVNPVGGASRLAIWVGPGAALAIGSRAGISNATLVAMADIRIGDDVRIGGGACVYDTDFHSLDLAGRLASPDTGVRKAPVSLAAGCFVGGHALVLKGSSLGAGAILGAGAVLAGSVPAGEIWAGSPARKIAQVPSLP